MSRTLYYVLDADHRPVKEPDLFVWAEWFENTTNRIVDWTQVSSQVTVSTVFLGLDHNFGHRRPPVLFETMIFGGPSDEKMWRYASWDDAETGHKAAVRMARAETNAKTE